MPDVGRHTAAKTPGSFLFAVQLMTLHSQATTVKPEMKERFRLPDIPECQPDLLVAFDVDPQAYRDTNGYVVSQQGKTPDFVLEVASAGTGSVDIGEKRKFYQGLPIPEYWRFDKTGEFHGERLAGERLVDGEYQPIPIADAGGVELLD